MQIRRANQLTAVVGDIVSSAEVAIPLNEVGKWCRGNYWKFGGGGGAIIPYFSYQTSYMISENLWYNVEFWHIHVKMTQPKYLCFGWTLLHDFWNTEGSLECLQCC
jgi:hypothetical protein